MESITRAGLNPPKMLTLMMTNNCNLNCRHCWPESLSHESMNPVPLKTLERLITDFCDLGAQEVCLTGGEPLTHPGWRELLCFACVQKGLERVHLQTNGTLLTETEYNFDRIPMLLQYLDRIGIGRFVSGTLVQAGRAADHSELAPPTPERYQWLLHLYHQNEIFGKRYHKMVNIACLEW
ncbi:MAG: radical SAM protein [Deltaproteobacteria bacterium]|nr:radical SAM protein [Deltaproteobacteria bacterium]